MAPLGQRGAGPILPSLALPLLLRLVAGVFMLPSRVIGLPRFSNVFQSGMVLQRQRPIEVWGFGASEGERLEVALLNRSSGHLVRRGRAIATRLGHWRTTLSMPPATATGVPMRLNLIRQGAESPLESLDDVVLGDVYLFSGQSNVDLPVSYVHQFSAADQEREEAFADEVSHDGRIRIMIVPAHCGQTYHDSFFAWELDHLPECLPCPPPFGPVKHVNRCNAVGGRRNNYTYCGCESLRWTRPTGANIRGFSAAAWFMGKALLSLDVLRGVPVGLVRSSWGATSIAVWSGPAAVAKCPQPGEPPPQAAPYVKSALFAHMVHPLKGLWLSAVVWLHGARNVGADSPYMGATYYSCALRSMISDWREHLGQHSLPFLVVESPVYCNELGYKTWHNWCGDPVTRLKEPDSHLPEIRLAQNEAEVLPHVYLVSTMDQGTLERSLGGTIHSPRKPELGRRLALAAQAAIYRDEQVVWSGPIAALAWHTGDGEVAVCFDTRGGGGLRLNESERCPAPLLSVFCTGATFELQANGSWVAPASVSLCDERVILGVPTSVGLVDRVRYAWADWPVCSLSSAAGMPARIFDIPVGAKGESGAQCPRIPAQLGDSGNSPSCRTTTTTTTTPSTALPALIALCVGAPVQTLALALSAALALSLSLLLVTCVAMRSSQQSKLPGVEAGSLPLHPVTEAEAAVVSQPLPDDEVASVPTEREAPGPEFASPTAAPLLAESEVDVEEASILPMPSARSRELQGDGMPSPGLMPRTVAAAMCPSHWPWKRRLTPGAA